MTAKQISSIKQLLRASQDDESSLQWPLPDSAFGFHAQQAVEKLYKVLLAHRLGAYPFSHDLKSLRIRVGEAGITLPSFEFRLEDLSDYAGNARYDEPIELDDSARQMLRESIAKLRAFVLTYVETL